MSTPNAVPSDATTRRPVPTHVLVIVAMGLGALTGSALGKQAGGLGTLGALTISLIKAVATPLLFFAVVRAITTTATTAASFGRMFVIACINVSIAIAIGITVSNLLRPGEHLTMAATRAPDGYADKRLDLLQTLESFVPADVVSPFQRNAVLSVVILALLLGFSLRVARAERADGAESIERAVSALYRVVEIILGWVIKLIPLAVFGVVAKTVGEHGLAPLRGLAAYVGAGLLGLLLHVIITYQLWLVLWARLPLRRFWAAAREPVSVALGSNSSLATLPVTLRALDQLGVSRASSALGACVGTNLNNDGIVLYEGMAALLVAQAHGIDLGVAQQLLVALVCVVAAMGVAGVPEAGFVSLAIVLNAAELPLDLLPLLLTVDWVIARGRSVANVLSDMVLSITLDGRGPPSRTGRRSTDR